MFITVSSLRILFVSCTCEGSSKFHMDTWKLHFSQEVIEAITKSHCVSVSGVALCSLPKNVYLIDDTSINESIKVTQDTL